MPAWDLREQQRLAGCIPLATLGGEQQSMLLIHQNEVHSYISQAFGTLTILKWWQNLDKTDVFAVFGASGREVLGPSGQSHPPFLAILIFLPPARRKWPLVQPLLLTKYLPCWPTFIVKWLPVASRNCQDSVGLLLFRLSPCQDFILSAVISCSLSALSDEVKKTHSWLFPLGCH